MEYWSDGVMILKRSTATLHHSINPTFEFPGRWTGNTYYGCSWYR